MRTWQKTPSVTLFATIFLCGIYTQAGAQNVTGKLASKTEKIRVVAYLHENADVAFSFLSAIQVAVDLLNANENILPNHEIVPVYIGSYGSSGLALMGFLREYTYMEHPQTLIGAILGPANSEPTAAIGALVSKLGIPLVTYAAIDPTMDLNMAEYRTVFRSIPSARSYIEAMVRMFNYFGWKRFALLFDYTENRYFKVIRAMEKRLMQMNATILAVEGFSSVVGQSVTAIFEKFKGLDARIIIVDLDDAGAQKVFCEAFHQQMYRPKVIWVTMFPLSRAWYRGGYKDGKMNCSESELLMASEGHFNSRDSPIRSDSTFITGTNNTAERLWEMIKERRRENNLNVQRPLTDDESFYRHSTLAWDGMWAIALMLHAKLPRCHNITFPLLFQTPAFFTCYRDYMDAATVLNQLKFEGISGPYQYEDKERLGDILLHQYRNTSYVPVGVHRTATNEFSIDAVQLHKLFKGSVIPRDQALFVNVTKMYSMEVIAVLWTASCMGVTLALVFLVINIFYRNVRLIKMSSPRINNLIILGCILCYLSVIFYGLDTATIPTGSIKYACDTVAIMLALGFTLSFGALFCKTWRVYKIFTAAKTMGRVAIKDMHLYAIIACMVAIDVIIFVVWMATSPFELEVKELNIIDDSITDTMTVRFVHQCSCKKQMYFTGAFYAYKGVLLIFGLFLAWETRTVKVEVLNDSKYIGMAVYNVAVLSTVGVICASVLYNVSNYEAGYVIFSLCIFLCTTVTLLLIFVPKVRLLSPGKSSSFCSDGPLSHTSFSESRSSRPSEGSDQRERQHSILERLRSFDKSQQSVFSLSSPHVDGGEQKGKLSTIWDGRDPDQNSHDGLNNDSASEKLDQFKKIDEIMTFKASPLEKDEVNGSESDSGIYEPGEKENDVQLDQD